MGNAWVKKTKKKRSVKPHRKNEKQRHKKMVRLPLQCIDFRVPKNKNRSVEQVVKMRRKKCTDGSLIAIHW